MLSASQIQAAVAAGVITPDQADRLESLDRPERFRILSANGLDEVFIALGVILFGALLSLVTPVIAAVGLWAAAAITARRRPLPLVAITACAGFAAACAGTGVALADLLRSDLIGVSLDNDQTALLAALLALVGTVIFQRRFGVPFAALIVAATTAMALVFAVDVLAGLWTERAARWADLAQTAIILICGLGALLLAAFLDRHDPDRSSKTSAAAFWLQIAATPMIAHAVLRFALVASDAEVAALDPVHMGAVFGLAAFLAGTALLLDRPAILAAGFLYLLVALGHGLSRLDFSEALAAHAILLVLAAGAAWLGLRWRGARRVLFRLPEDSPALRRPPPFEA